MAKSNFTSVCLNVFDLQLFNWLLFLLILWINISLKCMKFTKIRDVCSLKDMKIAFKDLSECPKVNITDGGMDGFLLMLTFSEDTL